MHIYFPVYCFGFCRSSAITGAKFRLMFIQKFSVQTSWSKHAHCGMRYRWRPGTRWPILCLKLKMRSRVLVFWMLPALWSDLSMRAVMPLKPILTSSELPHFKGRSAFTASIHITYCGYWYRILIYAIKGASVFTSGKWLKTVFWETPEDWYYSKTSSSQISNLNIKNSTHLTQPISHSINVVVSWLKIKKCFRVIISSTFHAEVYLGCMCVCLIVQYLWSEPVLHSIISIIKSPFGWIRYEGQCDTWRTFYRVQWGITLSHIKSLRPPSHSFNTRPLPYLYLSPNWHV